MRRGTIIVLLVLLLISIGCLRSSQEPVACTLDAKICPDGSAVGRIAPDCEFAPCPTSPPTITTVPLTTAPPKTTPAPVITTIPPTTLPPQTLGPVSDYLLKKGLYNLDVSPLEEDGSLDENDKALIDLISSTKIKTSWRETPYPSIIEDGIVRDEELTYVKLRIKVSEEIGSDYVKVVDNLWDKNLSLIDKLSEVWEKDSETATNAIKLSQIEYIEKAFEYELEDIAFTPEYIGDLEKLEEYHKYLEIKNKLNTESELFPGFSKETQEFIINTPWNQDGVDSSDIAYIDSLPSDFNVLDKNKNTDGGGELGYVEDWIEVFLKKNVYDASDDEGFLTWPLYCEDPQTITAFFDIEPSICPGNCDSGRRDWEGGKHTYDTHIGTDIVISKKTPILASFAGKVIFAEFDTDGSGNSIRLKHDNGYYSRYNHLVEDGFLVEINQRVNRGEVIGLSGNTGQAVTPHLHFQIWSHYPNGWQNMNEDPFRDESNPNSKSKWINDNEPLCINKNGNLNFAPLIIGDWLADNKGDYAKD